jgi:predicted ATPase
VVPALRRLIAEHPLRERLRGQLVLALYRSGRQADALRELDVARAQLVEELGVDPGPDLQRLHRAVLEQQPGLEWTAPPPSEVRSIPSVIGVAGLARSSSARLPAPTTKLIGRDHELQRIQEALVDNRMVTLSGPGGVGKSRLALAVAHEQAERGPVWLVELADVGDGRVVPFEIARAVGVVTEADPFEALTVRVGQQPGLLVLDTCEHLIDACAAAAHRLLRSCPALAVLATSRQPLTVAGEVAWPVPPLGVPAPDASLAEAGETEAVRLFCDRARAVRPAFDLDRSNAADVAAICRILDGLPLAIELAAARAKVLSVDQIAAHLDERFRLLTGGGRTTVPRQQTLLGAIGWSYDLLTAAEQSLFDTLGVFAGEFDLEAVAAVARLDVLEALDLVEQLVNKSMVEAEPARDRYRLLETLRQYAWARLVAGGRLDELRDAHAASFAALAARQARRMGDGGQHLDALDRLDRDYDNLRAALAWLIEQRRADDAARMVRRLRRLFIIRHPREGLGWFQAVVAIGDELPAKSRARVLADTAWAALNAGDFEAMARYAGAAIAAGGDDPPSTADWLFALVAMGAGNYARAVEHLRRAIPNAVANKDLTTQVFATGALVLALAEVGDEREARRLIPEAIGLAERLDNLSTLAHNYCQVAVALVRMGAPHEAATMWERSLIHVDTAGPAMACVYRCSYALKVDDPPKAARILAVAIPIAKEQLSGFQQAHPLLPAAAIAAAQASRAGGDAMRSRDSCLRTTGHCGSASLRARSVQRRHEVLPARTNGPTLIPFPRERTTRCGWSIRSR